MTTKSGKQPTPYAQAKAKIKALQHENSMLQRLLALRISHDQPDVCWQWSNSDAVVTFSWWSSLRADEGYVEIVQYMGDGAAPYVQVYGAITLRDLVRSENTYSAPWRLHLATMLAIPYSVREAADGRTLRHEVTS